MLQYLDEYFAELENAMLPAYEPRKVRAAQERSGNIYASTKMLKRVGIDNARIRKEISEEYEITPTYAQYFKFH